MPLMSIEAVVLDVIEGRKKSRFLKGSFYVISLGFQLGIKLRHLLYNTGLLKTFSCSKPVLSVGNIVAGGTGKTPFVCTLIKELSWEPGHIAILSRGYRSEGAKNSSLQVSMGFGPEVSSGLAGDEPYWLGLNTNAAIWIGKDRVLSANKAIEAGAQLLVLEDGFQHRRLKRDMEIVLLNARDLMGKGYFLPRGYLRDIPKRLQNADYIIVTYLEEKYDKVKIYNEIRRFSKAPILGFTAKYSLEEAVKGKKAGAFCGIAKPDSFYEALKSLGVDLVNTFTSSDHIIPSVEDLQMFAALSKSRGAEYLICTEKDFVKCPDGICLALPVSVLKMDLECVWNEDVWKEMIESIKYLNKLF